MSAAPDLPLWDALVPGLDGPAGPLSEEDFLALPEDRRVELLDGALLVSPSARAPHQRMSLRLALVLEFARPDGWEVFETVNVRVAPGRILIPDLTVVHRRGADTVVFDAADVVMVVEVVSPGSVVTDRAVKPGLYAAAGIPHYLRVELGPVGPHATAYRRVDGRYVEAVHAAPRERLRLTEPFDVDVDLAELLAAERPPRG